MLAIAGALAAKNTVPAGAGTLPTHTPLFVVLLIGIVLLVGALTFIPALALGPIVEHCDGWAMRQTVTSRRYRRQSAKERRPAPALRWPSPTRGEGALQGLPMTSRTLPGSFFEPALPETGRR